MVDAFKGCGQLLDSRPQVRVLLPDLLQRGPGRPEGGEVEADICARPRHRRPQCPESDDDIGYERRIAVDGKPAKPFRVGAAVDEGLVLQALGPRQAQLGASMGGPATVTLDMPLKN